MPFPARSLAVVGADYPNKRGPGRRFEIALCKPGEPVQLIPEPKNPADENAIAVLSERGVQIGYLPSERTVLIKKLINEGREISAIFQATAPWGAWIRLAFDGEQPVLPTQATAAAEEDAGLEFWPDYTPPDDWS